MFSGDIGDDDDFEPHGIDVMLSEKGMGGKLSNIGQIINVQRNDTSSYKANLKILNQLHAQHIATRDDLLEQQTKLARESQDLRDKKRRYEELLKIRPEYLTQAEQDLIDEGNEHRASWTKQAFDKMKQASALAAEIQQAAKNSTDAQKDINKATAELNKAAKPIVKRKTMFNTMNFTRIVSPEKIYSRIDKMARLDNITSMNGQKLIDAFGDLHKAYMGLARKHAKDPDRVSS